MAEWNVVSQEPVPSFDDRWKPVSTEPVADQWKPIATEPVAAAPEAPSFMDHLKGILGQVGAAGLPEGPKKAAAIEGRNALPGIAGDMVTSILGLPERAIKASQADVQQLGSGEPKETVAPAAETALMTMPFKRTVGGVRAHPGEAAAEPAIAPTAETLKPEVSPAAVAAEWKPVKTEPVEPTLHDPGEPPLPGEKPSPWAFKTDEEYNAANRAWNAADQAHYKWEREQSKKEAAAPLQFNDTRNAGQQYHGTPNPTMEVDPWHSSSKNYYGSGFYTTDAMDIAHGYTQRKGRAGQGSIYSATPHEPVKTFNMEDPIPDWLKKGIPDDGSEINSYIHSAIDGDLEGRVPKNTRELYDDLRNNSASEGYSSDTVQEIFDQLRYHVEQQGYGAMEHKGGLLTKKEPHKVIIYFEPDKLKIAPVDRTTFTKQAEVKQPEQAFMDRAFKPKEPVKTMNADAKVESISEPLAHPEPTPEQMNVAQSAANNLRKWFNPENLSDAARSAAADIRQAGGRAARDTETTRAAFEDVQKLTSKLSDAEKIELNDYIETRSKGAPLENKALQPVADAQREAVQSRKAKIEALDSTAQAEFRDDYLTHIYKDPEAARVAFTGPAKEGTGRFLKARTIPTLKEAMARGLEPITLDPLEMTQRYVDSMDRFIATRQVIETAKSEGHMKAYTRGEQPAGWVEVNTSHGSGSMPYYAPADYARIYNNFVDRGWSKSEAWGPALDSLQRGSNAITALKLGLSGFHALTMAKEAYASGIDRAVAQFASGQPIKGAISAVKSPTKFIENAVKGKQLKDIYLGRKEGTPVQNQIIDLITDAGGRMKGGRHAADYQFSAMDSYWNSIKRGSVKAEIKAAASESMKAYGLGSIKVLAQQFGRVMQTVAKPLFEHYIPALKNGAAYDMMSAWLEANPRATHAEQLKAARKVVDAIDDRFGEMIQDNIFWNKTMKQAAQTSMMSYSWALGTARAIGGGTASLVRNPARLSMKHPDWKPQANYALALPFVVATANAAYQYLKTGKAPDDIQDLMAPETGGMVPGVGTKQLVKERAQTPGYEKDVFGWLHSIKDEAFNKLSGAIQIPYALARNKDWKDQPIRDVRAPAIEQVGQLFKYITQQLTPISISKLNEGQQKGSKISKAEVLMGIKNAPAYLQDPKGSKDTADYYFGKDWDKKTNWEKSHAKKYGGPQ